MPTQLSSVDKSQVSYAPSMLIEIQDTAWRIRAVDYATNGGYVVTCDGLSQLVQGREAQFLSKNLQNGCVSKTFIDDTQPGGPREKTITYQAPLFVPNREEY